jgi:hypothetical protein
MGCVPAALKTGSSRNVAQGSSLCEMRPATRYHLCGSEELQSIDMKRTKDIAKIATPRSVVHPVSPDERAEAGKVLRNKVPTEASGRTGTRLIGGQIRSISAQVRCWSN